MKALDQESQELRANLSHYMGAPLPLSRITTGTDSLNIEVANNLSVDPWVHELLPEANEVTVKRERIVNGLVYLQSNAAFAVELAKVRGGPILWEVIERALAKQSCTDQCAGQSTCTCYPSKLKYYLYSTHYSILTASWPRWALARSMLTATLYHRTRRASSSSYGVLRTGPTT